MYQRRARRTAHAATHGSVQQLPARAFRTGHPAHAPLTAIGDAATLATAVAAASRDHDAHILATEELINVVEGDVAVGHVSHEVLGREREYTLYEIIDFAKPDTHFLVQSSWEQI